ncbi:MAG TPA: hypothetical protein VHM02_11740 [Thermoanaerobaculia bacterium]|nr:hypothetical protein [Thermoanaerobaculia bacterium]
MRAFDLRSLFTLFLAVAASSVPPLCTTAAAPNEDRQAVSPSLDPLVLIRGLSPSRLGVDSRGNLWGWNQRTSRLLVVSPAADLLSSLELPPLRALDVDATHGVVLLGIHGDEVSVLGLEGEEHTSWPLPDEATDVAWVGPGRVAISTARSTPPIELWHVGRKERLASFGEAPAVELGPGATLLRKLELEVHAASGTLYALDSVEGTLTAYALDGSPKGRHRVPNPRREELARWLTEADRAARAKGRVATPLYTILRTAVDRAGAAWVVTGCSEDRRTASLERWMAGGEARRVDLALSDACCSLAFTVWQERVLFTYKPDTVAQRCVVDRRLP